MEKKTLFLDHLSIMESQIEGWLKEEGGDALALCSGTTESFFYDFLRFCPWERPHSWIVWTKKLGFRFLGLVPDDFWEEQPSAKSTWWFDLLQGEEWKTEESLEKRLEELLSGNEVIGYDSKKKIKFKNLKNLQGYRCYKTPYEIFCLQEAALKAKKGHVAARKAFQDGKSELEIHLAYLQALGEDHTGLPYESIVAQGSHAGILHYKGKFPEKIGENLLIDSGAKSFGYVSDVSRTYASSTANSLYQDLLKALTKLQKELCNQVQCGTSWVDLHEKAHEGISQILTTESHISKKSFEEFYDLGGSELFFPHGLGHRIGLQVHDVGHPEDEKQPQNPKFPRLRLRHILRPHEAITVEPGLYFIPYLLNPAREKFELSSSALQDLIPMGGIRVEDVIVTTDQGPMNLTSTI